MNIQEQVDAGVTSAFDKIKNFLSPKAVADLEKANQTITDLNKKISDLEASVKSKDGEIAKLTTDLSAATEAKDKAETDAKETKANVDKIAHQKAANIEQGRGVTQPVQDKGTQVDAPAGTDVTPATKAEEYRALVSKGDNRGAAAFYAKNKDEIFSGK
jgi:septal ring factor EnvC (AmiA/AmiB activator)